MQVWQIVLVLAVVYQVKHLLADYFGQGGYMLGKFKPGWDFVGPLLAHVSVHAAMTTTIGLVVLSVADVPVGVRGYAFLIGLFDAVVHFVMDRLKAGPKYMGRWKPVTAAEYLEMKDIIAHSRDWYVGLQSNVEAAKRKLAGNTYFWWSLGVDQCVHHLTHYACIYFMLRIGGWL